MALALGGLLLAAPAIVAVPLGAATPPGVVAVGVVAHVPKSATRLGRLPATRHLDLGVVLATRDPAGLAGFAAQVSTPGSAAFHRYLTPAGFARRFGAPASEVASVAKALRRQGLKVGAVAANHLVIPVHGSVAGIEHAFGTELSAYRLADGSLGWAAATPAEVPAALAGSVTNVLGLDNLAVPHAELMPASSRASATVRASRPSAAAPHAAARTGAPVACAAARNDASSSTGFTDTQIAQAYGLSNLYARGDLAQGQTIALYELEPFARSDLETFDRCYFGSSHTDLVSSERLDGFTLSGPGTGEAILDVEDLSALAPKAHIVVYEAPNTTFGAIDAYNAIVSEDRANIVTTSWGECEAALQTSAPGAQQLENTLFEEAAAQGQSVFAATGDTGSDDCASTPFSANVPVQPYLSVDDPASQPYVIAVGGTSLAVSSPLGPAGAETAWNDGTNGGATGGGISATWASPPWQAGSGIEGVLPGANRQVPDVSASADEQRGITVFSDTFVPPLQLGAGAGTVSGWSTIGGTSSSTPIWAAVTAEIAASGVAGTSCASLPIRSGGPDLGFVAPELYAVASTPGGYDAAFHDITKGNNDIFQISSGAYSAGPGFNLATGLGTPVVTEPDGSGGLAVDLCAEATGASLFNGTRPTISSLSPTAGPSSGGTAVTLSLTAPIAAGTRVLVSVGTASAQVLSASGSTVSFITPQSPLTPGSPSFDGAGGAEVVVTESGPNGSYSSLVAPSALFQYVDDATPTSALPVVSGVGPYGGNRAGGNTITVYGSGFSSSPPTVTFGGVPAVSVRVLSDRALSVVVPPRAADSACASGAGFQQRDNCQVEVVVNDASGSSPQARILPPLSGKIVFSPQGVIPPAPGTEVAPAVTEYDYAPTPVVTSISPNPGDDRGDHSVTLHGRGFSLNTFEWVNFGPASNPQSQAVEIREISGSSIVIAPPPAASPGRSRLRGGVSVQTVAGLSKAVAFSYAGVPSVTGLSVRKGSVSGGTRITVSGRNLSGVTLVQFVSEVNAHRSRSVGLSEVLQRASDSLVVIAPSGLSGPVHVEPCSPSGCARPAAPRDTFVFEAARR